MIRLDSIFRRHRRRVAKGDRIVISSAERGSVYCPGMVFEALSPEVSTGLGLVTLRCRLADGGIRVLNSLEYTWRLSSPGTPLSAMPERKAAVQIRHVTMKQYI